MKIGSTLNDVASRVDHLRRTTRGFLAKPNQISLVAETDAPTLNLNDGSGSLSFGINDLVHDQIAAYADIPQAYYRRMLDHAPQLLGQNANTWFQKGSGRRMVRTVSCAEGAPVIRALLSDRYRPLDNYQLLEAILPLLQEQGIKIESCELTEKKLYVKAVSQRVTSEVKVGEAVMAGIIVSNSEIGFGSLSISPLIYTLRCTNGMIVEDSSLRQHHVGRRHSDPGDSDIQHLLSDEARAADNRAFFLKVRDVAKAALDEGIFRLQVDRLRQAAGTPILSTDLDKVVELTSKRFLLSEEEGNGVLSHLIRGGDLSQWGLCSAVTRYSQDIGNYDRATELEKIGGRLIELSKSEWSAIASVN
jgi:hypothetical protein